MAQRIDPRYFPSLIDANVLDRLGRSDDADVDKILALAEDQTIYLMLPHSVEAEIEHPNTPAGVKRRAQQLIFTEPVSLTHIEIERHQRVRDMVRGNALPGQHDRDAYHLAHIIHDSDQI